MLATIIGVATRPRVLEKLIHYRNMLMRYRLAKEEARQNKRKTKKRPLQSKG